jgi:hypothetical protein
MSGAPRTPPRTRSPLPPAVAVNATSGIPYGHVPAYLPGSASLVEELDKKLMVVLRDGRHLIGVSFALHQLLDVWTFQDHAHHTIIVVIAPLTSHLSQPANVKKLQTLNMQ